MTITFTTGGVVATIATMAYLWLTFLWVGRQAYALYECKKFSKAIKEIILPMIERMQANQAVNNMTVSSDDLEIISTLSRTINWGRVNMKREYIGQWPWRDANMLMDSLMNTNAVAYLILERMTSPFGKGVKQTVDLNSFARDFTLLINRFLDAKESFTLVGITVEQSCCFILYVKIAVCLGFIIPLWCLWIN